MQSESHERINIGGLKRAAKRKGDKSNFCILSLRDRSRESSVDSNPKRFREFADRDANDVKGWCHMNVSLYGDGQWYCDEPASASFLPVPPRGACN